MTSTNPPLPHLNGKSITSGTNRGRNLVGGFLNTILLLVGILFLLWACRYLFNLITNGYPSAAMGTIDILFVILVPICGAGMIAFSVNIFVKQSKQRKQDTD